MDLLRKRPPRSQLLLLKPDLSREVPLNVEDVVLFRTSDLFSRETTVGHIRATRSVVDLQGVCTRAVALPTTQA